MTTSATVQLTAETGLPTRYGNFKIFSFRLASASTNEQPHLALRIDTDKAKMPLVRVHSECITGDVFGSLRCDCGKQLDSAFSKIASHGSGAVIYLRQEGRGIGIENKLKAYTLQENGFDTADANIELGLPIDARDYTSAGLILASLGIFQCELLTNNPEKVSALRQSGIEIKKVTPLVTPNSHHLCQSYLNTKKEKMGHHL